MSTTATSLPQHENLWPARSAIVLATLLYVTLPDKLAVGYKWIPRSSSWRCLPF